MVREGYGNAAHVLRVQRSHICCDAYFVDEVEGIWKGSITLPCAYVPEKDFLQQTLKWTVVHDQSSGTVFRRDSSGDHVLLSKYRDRVSVLKDAPGNVSLHILNLEVSDRGTYTCQVTWRASNNSLIAKDITTKVEVVKVAATKPIIRASEPGLTFPAGARASLTCVANGSPPISYRWFRSIPGGKALLLSSQAELAWDSLQPSDTGKYYCEAENRVGAGAVQQSDAVQLTVRGESAELQLDRKQLQLASFRTGTEQCSYFPSLKEENAKSPRSPPPVLGWWLVPHGLGPPAENCSSITNMAQLLWEPLSRSPCRSAHNIPLRGMWESWGDTTQPQVRVTAVTADSKDEDSAGGFDTSA
uniref:Ig-like domain-containing protein n=1 Tax=Accipiter nisus TaxID=211598 RepID=A0A8B9MGR5_9AVES